jgi:O-methyltransferase
MTETAAPAPHPGLAGARPDRAVGPGPEPEALRRAYLELLKLALCDLVGTTTGSVGRMEDGIVASRELAGDGRRLRAAGMDWPKYGLTMVGLRRLDDLQGCVEQIVRDGVEGDLIEAGSWRGGASMLMRATLDSLGERGRTVWVADSFQGFPEAGEADREHDQWAAMHFLGVPLDEVRASFERLGLDSGVEWVPGFFEDTLAGLGGRRWALVRLDGDTYDATMHTLRTLYPGLARGGHLVVDDYGALEECRRAVDEFRAEQEIAAPLEEIDWTGVRWRKDSDPADAPAVPAAPGGRAAPRAVERPADAAVPSAEELALTRQVAALRAELDRTRAELERLRATPLRRLRAGVGRRLRERGR